ncbi:hypothetical protein SCA6_001202 [Theobroma cacao]
MDQLQGVGEEERDEKDVSDDYSLYWYGRKQLRMREKTSGGEGRAKHASLPKFQSITEISPHVHRLYSSHALNCGHGF